MLPVLLLICLLYLWLVGVDWLLCCVLSLVFVWVILISLPYLEKYNITDNSINTLILKERNTIPLPHNITIIFSYADLHLSQNIQSHQLKDRCFVSIVKQIDLEKILTTLHLNHVKKYSNSTIEDEFKSDFIYSFVYDIESIKILSQNRNINIIVPETLISKLDIDVSSDNIFVDIGY